MGKTLEPCILVADFMRSAPKHTDQMTMIPHSNITEFFVIDVTKSGVIINQFIKHSHYHTFLEPKLVINVFDVLFKCVYKYLCKFVVNVIFFYKSNSFLRIECLVKILYVVTKSAGNVFLIRLGVAPVRFG